MSVGRRQRISKNSCDIQQPPDLTCNEHLAGRRAAEKSSHEGVGLRRPKSKGPRAMAIDIKTTQGPTSMSAAERHSAAGLVGVIPDRDESSPRRRRSTQQARTP